MFTKNQGGVSLHKKNLAWCFQPITLTPTPGEEIPSVCIVNGSFHPIESVQSAFASGAVGDRDSALDTVGCDEDIGNLSLQEFIENRASTPNIDLNLGEPHFSSLISDIEHSVPACFNNSVCE